MSPFDALDTWPVDTAVAAIVDPQAAEPITTTGPIDTRFALASLSKPMAAWAIMIGVEEGIVTLDEPVVPPPNVSLNDGTTVRHLLAHASGLPFDGDAPVAPLAQRRIYSNTGIEVAAATLADSAGMPFADYLHEAVFAPLQMRHAQLVGSPAHGVHATVVDVARFVEEVLRPSLLAPATSRLVVSVQYSTLAGIVPGVGKFDPCPWGLGFEIKGHKGASHWMGSSNSDATVGHFGGAGTMMWADPHCDRGAVALTDRPFQHWAIEAISRWRSFSDAVVHGAQR